MKDENYYLAQANYYLARALLKDEQKDEPKINHVCVISDTVPPDYTYEDMKQWCLWDDDNTVWTKGSGVRIRLEDAYRILTLEKAKQLTKALNAAVKVVEKENKNNG